MVLPFGRALLDGVLYLKELYFGPGVTLEFVIFRVDSLVESRTYLALKLQLYDCLSCLK